MRDNDCSTNRTANFALLSHVREPYTYRVGTRGILVLVSAMGVTATLIAVAEGAWVYALVFYGMSVIGLGVLLRRAVRQHRTQTDQPLRTAVDEAPSDTDVPPVVLTPHS